MTKIFFASLAFLIVFASCEDDKDSSPSYTSATVSMGTDAVNDVYYSFENGQVKSVERTGWDIAFSVPVQTASILINEDAGVELYCLQEMDTNDWSSVTEASFAGLEKRYNNKSNWQDGAFNHYSNSMFNYGWGTYHAGTPDHNVGGDSIYVIKLSNGLYKKFMVRVKIGLTSTYVVRWADLTGGPEVIDKISTAPYFATKHFVHYSIVNKQLVDYEPDKSSWDLLFTRYMAQIPTGPSSFIYHPLAGILSNQKYKIAEITDTEVNLVTPADTIAGFSSNNDEIGYGWYAPDQVSHEINLVNNLSYFVKTSSGRKYHLYFTDYSLNSTGTISFKFRKID